MTGSNFDNAIAIHIDSPDDVFSKESYYGGLLRGGCRDGLT